jgi:hypothetical protein
MNGFDVMVVRCDGVADIGGVSRAHMIFNTPILWKKITYHGKVVVSAIGDDVTDTGNISVSDLSYLSIRSKKIVPVIFFLRIGVLKKGPVLEIRASQKFYRRWAR